MAIDRSIRTLNALRGASSNRVMNLCALAPSQTNNASYHAAPLFHSPKLNTSIILKHNLRANERDFFDSTRVLSTKVIIPFNLNDLSMGGRSLFVGQKNFREAIEDATNYREPSKLQRDIDILELIDGLPSLDPFLVREHLDRSGFKPDPSYFVLSNADQQRMADYSWAEVQKLTLMAAGNSGHIRDPAMQRMTKALLSNEMNELLEQLRVTLQLDLSKFSDGIYCWRGFLYYKWGLQELWPRLITVLRAMKALKPQGKITADQAHYLRSITDALILGVKQSDQVVRKIIAIYDDAYAGLIERKDPRQFRDFLLTAPSRFVELGEKLGALSHIVSFWQYRFSGNAPETLPDVEDLMVIFHDFAQSLGLEVASAR